MSDIKRGRLDLYGAKHSKCDHTMTLGCKALMSMEESKKDAELV